MPAGAGVPGGGEAAGSRDLLVAAAGLRWSRPDLTAALADHVLMTAALARDRDLWLAAAGWAVHARSATGDGREAATDVLERLADWAPDPLAPAAAGRLRVELALVAVNAGEPAAAGELLEPVAVEETAPDLRADAFGVLARCAVETDPAQAEDALARADRAWSQAPAPLCQIGSASAALVAAAAHRRSGRPALAADSAADGLARLDRLGGAAAGSSPAAHLVAALSAEWVLALLDAGRTEEAKRGCAELVPRLADDIRPSRQLARLRLAVARTIVAESTPTDTAQALSLAVRDAAACDAPDLEAVCCSALRTVYQKSGSPDQASTTLQRGIAAQRRDQERGARFRIALGELMPEQAALHPHVPEQAAGPRSLIRPGDRRDTAPDGPRPAALAGGGEARPRSRHGLAVDRVWNVGEFARDSRATSPANGTRPDDAPTSVRSASAAQSDGTDDTGTGNGEPTSGRSAVWDVRWEDVDESPIGNLLMRSMRSPERPAEKADHARNGSGPDPMSSQDSAPSAHARSVMPPGDLTRPSNRPKGTGREPQSPEPAQRDPLPPGLRPAAGSNGTGRESARRRHIEPDSPGVARPGSPLSDLRPVTRANGAGRESARPVEPDLPELPRQGSSLADLRSVTRPTSAGREPGRPAESQPRDSARPGSPLSDLRPVTRPDSAGREPAHRTEPESSERVARNSPLSDLRPVARPNGVGHEPGRPAESQSPDSARPGSPLSDLRPVTRPDSAGREPAHRTEPESSEPAPRNGQSARPPGVESPDLSRPGSPFSDLLRPVTRPISAGREPAGAAGQESPELPRPGSPLSDLRPVTRPNGNGREPARAAEPESPDPVQRDSLFPHLPTPPRPAGEDHPRVAAGEPTVPHLTPVRGQDSLEGPRARRSAREETEARRAAAGRTVEPAAFAAEWIRAELADLDRIWQRISEPAVLPDRPALPAAKPAEVDPVPNGATSPPRPEPADEADAAECTVAIDIARDGRRLAGRRSARILRAVADVLTERMPVGAHVSRDEPGMLSVALPGWRRDAATAWMRGALPGVLDDHLDDLDVAGLHLRAAVHDGQGPLGAHLLQRLDPLPPHPRPGEPAEDGSAPPFDPAAGTDPLDDSGRSSAPAAAPAGGPDVDRTATPERDSLGGDGRPAHHDRGATRTPHHPLDRPGLGNLGPADDNRTPGVDASTDGATRVNRHTGNGPEPGGAHGPAHRMSGGGRCGTDGAEGTAGAPADRAPEGGRSGADGAIRSQQRAGDADPMHSDYSGQNGCAPTHRHGDEDSGSGGGSGSAGVAGGRVPGADGSAGTHRHGGSGSGPGGSGPAGDAAAPDPGDHSGATGSAGAPRNASDGLGQAGSADVPADRVPGDYSGTHGPSGGRRHAHARNGRPWGGSRVVDDSTERIPEGIHAAPDTPAQPGDRTSGDSSGADDPDRARDTADGPGPSGAGSADDRGYRMARDVAGTDGSAGALRPADQDSAWGGRAADREPGGDHSGTDGSARSRRRSGAGPGLGGARMIDESADRVAVDRRPGGEAPADDGSAPGATGASDVPPDGEQGSVPGRSARPATSAARRRTDLLGPADDGAEPDPGERPPGRRRRRLDPAGTEPDPAAGQSPAADGKARRHTDASTEGLGLADLLAGALAEYRGI